MPTFTFGCRPKASSIMMGWSFSTDRTVANQEIPAAKIAAISSGEIDGSPDISLVRLHVVLLVYSTRIDRKLDFIFSCRRGIQHISAISEASSQRRNI